MEIYTPTLSRDELQSQLIEIRKSSIRMIWKSPDIKPLHDDILYYTVEFGKFEKLTDSERIFAILNDHHDRPKCYCGEYVLYKNNGRYGDYCSKKCVSKSPLKQQEIDNFLINIENYTPILSIDDLQYQIIEISKHYKIMGWRLQRLKPYHNDILFYTKGFYKFEDLTKAEQIYAIINNRQDRPKCYCGEYVKYQNIGIYCEYCSSSCAGLDPEVQQQKNNKREDAQRNKVKVKQIIQIPVIKDRDDLHYQIIQLPKQYKGVIFQSIVLKPFHNAILFYTKEFDKFLNITNNERLYAVINNITDRPICKTCNEYVNYNGVGVYREHCSNSCAGLDPKIRQKAKDTYRKKNSFEHNMQNPEAIKDREENHLAKYGVINPMQRVEVRQLHKDNYFAKHGVTNCSQNPTVKQQKKDTHYIRTGYNYSWQDPEVVKQFQANYFAEHGVTNCSQNPIIKQQKIDTNQMRRNVDHPLQDPVILAKQQKSSYSFKPFMFLSGNVDWVQGYEPEILRELVYHFEEDDIIVGVENVPEIWYTTDDGEKHRYYPDIFIKSRNMIIEVKSTYTLRLEKGSRHPVDEDISSINLLKRQASIDAGFIFWFAIGTGKKMK